MHFTATTRASVIQSTPEQCVCVWLCDKLHGSFTRRQDATRGIRLQNLETETIDSMCVCFWKRSRVLFQRAGQWKYFGEIADGMTKDVLVFMWMKNILLTASCRTLFQPHFYHTPTLVPLNLPTLGVPIHILCYLYINMQCIMNTYSFKKKRSITRHLCGSNKCDFISLYHQQFLNLIYKNVLLWTLFSLQVQVIKNWGTHTQTSSWSKLDQ